MWRKVVCWSTKAAILSLKRLKIGQRKSYYGRPIGTLSNGTIPNRYGLLFPNIGGLQPPPKTPIVIISGTNYSYTKRTELQLQLQLRTSNFVSTFIGSIGTIKSPLKISKIFRARIAHSSTFLCIDKFTHVMFRFRRHISVSNNK